MGGALLINPPKKSDLGRQWRDTFGAAWGNNLLNSKAVVVYVAVFPGFLAPSAPLANTLTLTAIYVAVATAVHRLIATIAGAARDWVGNTGHAVQMRRGIVADAGWCGGLGVVANAVAASNGALGLSHRLNHQRHVVGVGVRCNAVAKVEYMRSGPKGVHDAQRLAHQGIAARHHMFGC